MKFTFKLISVDFNNVIVVSRSDAINNVDKVGGNNEVRFLIVFQVDYLWQVGGAL